MSKVYFPIRYIDVPASPPHEGDPAYRVSIGTEHWSGGSQPETVYKVQMAYGGVVAGRKTASYPDGSDDLDRVHEALKVIRAGGGAKARGRIEATGPDRGIPIAEMNQMLNALG